MFSVWSAVTIRIVFSATAAVSRTEYSISGDYRATSMKFPHWMLWSILHSTRAVSFPFPFAWIRFSFCALCRRGWPIWICCYSHRPMFACHVRLPLHSLHSIECPLSARYSHTLPNWNPSIIVYHRSSLTTFSKVPEIANIHHFNRNGVRNVYFFMKSPTECYLLERINSYDKHSTPVSWRFHLCTTNCCEVACMHSPSCIRFMPLDGAVLLTLIQFIFHRQSAFWTTFRQQLKAPQWRTRA